MLYFVHGNSCSSATWEALLQVAGFPTEKITLLDFPGHRLNNAGHGLDHYTFSSLSNWLAQQLEGQEDYSIVGHSMGGHLATQALALVSHQPKKLIFSGTPPLKVPLNMPEAFIPNPAMGLAFKPGLNEEEFTTLKGLFWGEARPYDSFREDIMGVNPNMKVELASDLAKPDAIGDELELLQGSTAEVYTINGAKEKLVNIAYIKSLEGKVFKACHEIAGTSHFPMVEKPEEYAKLLKACLED